MNTFARPWLVATGCALTLVSAATAQQNVPSLRYVPQQTTAPQPSADTAQQNTAPQAAPPTTSQTSTASQAHAEQPTQPVTPQVPPGFQLNQLQQQQLEAVLDAWQAASARINTFDCNFERLEYVVAFGPNNGASPLNKNKGKLSYQKPDKGSFEITEVNTYQAGAAQPAQPPASASTPPAAPAPGTWVPQPNAISDHWVCDGKSVYQYRPDLKQLVEHPIPPQFQGQAIVDGPLPFLFGADKQKLLSRYWMRIDQQPGQNANQIWLVALPKSQAQAADFTEVDVVLDSTLMMPLYMQVWKPNRDHDVYIFDIKNASVNGIFDRVKAAIFSRPSVPRDWKLVVENVPLPQAAQAPPAPQQPQAR